LEFGGIGGKTQIVSIVCACLVARRFMSIFKTFNHRSTMSMLFETIIIFDILIPNIIITYMYTLYIECLSSLKLKVHIILCYVTFMNLLWITTASFQIYLKSTTAVILHNLLNHFNQLLECRL